MFKTIKILIFKTIYQASFYLMPRQKDAYSLPLGVFCDLRVDKVLELSLKSDHEICTGCDTVRVKSLLIWKCFTLPHSLLLPLLSLKS